jgi:hypothetical protein
MTTVIGAAVGAAVAGAAVGAAVGAVVGAAVGAAVGVAAVELQPATMRVRATAAATLGTRWNIGQILLRVFRGS